MCICNDFSLSVMDEHVIGSDEKVGEFRLPLRQLKPYELIHYHVYLEKNVTVSCLPYGLWYQL